MSSSHAPPPRRAPDAFASAPGPAPTPAPSGGVLSPPSRGSWLPTRGQPTAKLCVHVSVSLRGRLDRAQRCLRRYPDIAGVLRSRNALIAYACHRLCVELEGPGHTEVPGQAGSGLHQVIAGVPGGRPPGEPSDFRRPAMTEGSAPPQARPVPQWAASAPLYRMPWEADFAERRCQLTLRVPPPFAAQLRELHSELLAAPRHAMHPDLAAVFTFSELIALACHELCGHIEADTAGAYQP